MDSETEFLKGQIVRLLKNESSRQEAKEFLQLPPDLLDAYLDEKEWEQLKPGIVPSELSDVCLKQINRLKVPKVHTLLCKYGARAAVILLVVVGMVLYYTGLHTSHNPVAGNDLVKQAPIAKERIIRNQGRTAEKYTMPDQSVVELAPGSTLRYSHPVEADRRSLWLEGEAVFHVARDAHRPFTVYAKGFATTALGTVFKITSFKGNKDARVCVISGKIVVRNGTDSATALYLNAGQQCRFEITTQKLEMLRIRSKKPVKVSQDSLAPATHRSDVIAFNNTSLPEVLHRVSDIYNVPMKFSSETLGKRKFTGSFKKEEPLEKVLGTLLLLNDLQYKKIADTLYVSPK